MKHDLQSYFRPADWKQRARDELALCVQTNYPTLVAYIEAFRRCCAKVGTINDEEKLDRFIRGLTKKVRI